jgi:site-specific DNA recombinase
MQRDRPGLNSLLQAAALKAFDCVIVDDLTRLSREFAHTSIILKELELNNIELHSVEGNLHSTDIDLNSVKHIKDIIDENYTAYFRGLTLRGQLAQKERGFFLREEIFGYRSEPSSGFVGKKGHPRSDGNKMIIVPEEAAIVTQIFQMYVSEIPLTNIAIELNKDASNKPLRGDWNARALARLIRNEKYVGQWVWGKRQNVVVPETGTIRRVLRDEPLFVGAYEDLRIIPQVMWEQAQDRLDEAKRTRGNKRGNQDISKRPCKHVAAFPKELLSGTTCSECGGAILTVSAKAGGYFGCINGARGACTNNIILKKSVAESMLLAEVGKLIFSAETMPFQKNAEDLVAQMCANISDEISAKTAELIHAQKGVNLLLDFIVRGTEQVTNAFKETLHDAEKKLTTLTTELKILEITKRKICDAPTEEWIPNLMAHVSEALEKPDKSAVLMRKLVIQITLHPITLDDGKPGLSMALRLSDQFVNILVKDYIEQA